jgi:hypothetical protein|tara:strand:- start:312 stop:542 length:231 start_codon:yes stop_codon:yes gene_type:complete
MDFPPIPPLNLTITELTIDEIDVSKFKLDSELIDLPLTPIYVLFICIFVLVFIQTGLMILFLYNYRREKGNRLLFG